MGSTIKTSIITFPETWRRDRIGNTEIDLKDYVLCRAERGDRGGGVASYASSHLVSELIIPDVLPVYFH